MTASGDRGMGMMGHIANLSEERRTLQETAHQFAMQEVLPLANELDPQKQDIPDELIRKLAELGYFGIMIPRAYGGLGLGVFEYCLVSEALSRAWMSVASIIARGNGMMVQAHFSDEQRERYLPRMARGDLIGAFALSEAEAGSDVANISCQATRAGDTWLINGEKKWCGHALKADFIVLFARSSPSSDPRRRHLGISAFLIEKERGVFPPGLSGTPIDKIGYHGLSTWNLVFKDFPVPASALVGPEGQGFKCAMSGLDIGRAHTAARALGLAQGALEDALAYARQRVQFGQPIAAFQAIRFKLAEMATQVEAARHFTYYVADQLDSGRRCDMEAAMVKLFASEMAERVTSEALQVLGGNGYTTNYAVERHWRDARLTRIFEGTSEIQKLVISDRLLGDSLT